MDKVYNNIIFREVIKYINSINTRFLPKNDNYWTIKATEFYNSGKKEKVETVLCLLSEKHYKDMLYKCTPLKKKSIALILSFECICYLAYQEYSLIVDEVPIYRYDKKVYELVNLLTKDHITILEVDAHKTKFHFETLEKMGIRRRDLENPDYKNKALFLYDRWRECLPDNVVDKVMKDNVDHIIKVQKLCLEPDDYKEWYKLNVKGKPYSEIVRSFTEIESVREDQVSHAIRNIQRYSRFITRAITNRNPNEQNRII